MIGLIIMLRTHDELRQFYVEQFEQYGAVPRGAAWMDSREQELRIEAARALVKVVRGTIPTKVLEIGCGYGVLPLMWKNIYPKESFRYVGVDLVEPYIQHAQTKFYKDPDAVFVCQPFEDFPIDRAMYGLTIAIGVVAWQPEEKALELLRRLWGATLPGGVMLFTYLPGNPFAPMEINMLRTQLSARQWIEYSGYAQSGERMVLFQKPSNYDEDLDFVDEDYADVDLQPVED